MATEHLRASAPERARRAAAPFFFARRAQRRRGRVMGLPAPEHVRDRRRRLRERPQVTTGEHGSGVVAGALVGAANNAGRSDVKRERCQAAKQRAKRYHPAWRRAVTRRACADARMQPPPARARGSRSERPVAGGGSDKPQLLGLGNNCGETGPQRGRRVRGLLSRFAGCS